MRSHIDVLIFHTDICKGALQIILMSDVDLRFRRLHRETLRNEVEHD